jgi:thiamine biosynthesis lipoprotein
MKKIEIYIIIGLVLSALFQFFHSETKEQKITFFAMDTQISISVKSNSDQSKILEEAKDIFMYYHKISNKHVSYVGVVNPHFIKTNDLTDEYLILSDELYEMIEYSININKNVSSVFDISKGNIIDYYKSGEFNEDNLVLAIKNHREIILFRDNRMLNNKPNIDLGAIAKGYSSAKAYDYLTEKGLTEIMINSGGNIITGDKSPSYYKIGVQGPENKVIHSFNVNNMAVVTSGNYDRYIEIDNVKYGHIIDFKTNLPANLYNSVTIITEDFYIADPLSTILFILPLEEGKELIEKIPNTYVIWQTKDNLLIKSKGIENYE